MTESLTEDIGSEPVVGEFRTQNKWMIVTYKSHMVKESLKKFFMEEMGAERVEIAHESGDSAAGYLHTHVVVSWKNAFNTSSARRFDFHGVHPHVKKIGNKGHWQNCIRYLAKEDPENAHLKDEAFNLADKIWAFPTVHDALRTVQRASDVSGTVMLYRMKPRETEVEDFEPREWQQKVLDVIASKPDDRSVHWVVDPAGGAGKSRLCRHVLVNGIGQVVTRFDGGRNAAQLIKGFLESGWNGRCLLVDLARSSEEHQIYGPLEEIKNGLVTSTKYEGGTLSWTPGHVIVFANFPPDYSKMSWDRWRVMDLTVGSDWSRRVKI